MPEPFSDPLLATTPPTARIPPWANRQRANAEAASRAAQKPPSFADVVLDDDDDELAPEPSGALPEAVPPPSALPGEPKKRGGRKPGSGNTGGSPSVGKRKKLKSLTKLMLHSHVVMASAFQADELLLDEEEARDLSAAISDVLAYYKVDVDGKAGAWIALCFVCVFVYGTRGMAIIVRKRNESRTKPIESPMNENATYATAAE